MLILVSSHRYQSINMDCFSFERESSRCLEHPPRAQRPPSSVSMPSQETSSTVALPRQWVTSSEAPSRVIDERNRPRAGPRSTQRQRIQRVTVYSNPLVPRAPQPQPPSPMMMRHLFYLLALRRNRSGWEKVPRALVLMLVLLETHWLPSRSLRCQTLFPAHPANQTICSTAVTTVIWRTRRP